MLDTITQIFRLIFDPIVLWIQPYVGSKTSYVDIVTAVIMMAVVISILIVFGIQAKTEGAGHKLTS